MIQKSRRSCNHIVVWFCFTSERRGQGFLKNKQMIDFLLERFSGFEA
jgi:hypothetical protein